MLGGQINHNKTGVEEACYVFHLVVAIFAAEKPPGNKTPKRESNHHEETGLSLLYSFCSADDI